MVFHINKLEQVVYAAERFALNGKTYTTIRISPEYSIDEKNALTDDFLKGFKSQEEALRMADYYFAFSKWLLYKTVYRFDKSFLSVLVDTEDMVFHAQSLQSLPVQSFFIACEDEERLGYFVYTETVNVDINGNAVNDTVFIVVDVLDVMGDKLHMRKDTLWISNGQKLSAALEEWMREKNSMEFYEEAYHNMKMAIQVAYYLSAQNAVIKEVKTPKSKRPHRTNGKPMNIRQWEVGYRISTPFLAEAHSLSDAASMPDEASTGISPRPHIRRAHWHHYWAGPGKTQLIVKWLEPVWVNGSSEDIIAVEHKVD